MTLADLKKEKRWCVWAWEPRQDKPEELTKVPYNANSTTGGKAKSNKPATWATYDAAYSAWKASPDVFAGVGLFFSDDLCGTDVDGDHGKSGEHNANEADVLNMFAGTYAERSPSDTGVHILAKVDRAQLPKDGKAYRAEFYNKPSKGPGKGLEFYAGGLTNRFFTFTGNQISDTDTVADMTPTVLKFLDTYMRRDSTNTHAGSEPAPAAASDPGDVGDADTFIAARLDLARKAKNRDKFTRLYDQGDVSAYGDDDSAADQALCELLAFWLNKDPALIDQAFRGSKLYRGKWDRDDYRENTITKGIDLCKDCYREPRKRGEALPRFMLPRLDLAVLEEAVRQHGFYLQYNRVKAEYETLGTTPAGRTPSLDDLIAILYNDLVEDYKGVTMDVLKQFITYIAREHEYNPVLELLAATTWDGVDRLPQVYALLGVESDELSKTLIYKWLLQAVALLHNADPDPHGAAGCLVFLGPQGVGKTSFFAHLALKRDWFGEGKHIDDRDKDTSRRVVTNWITELGEVEATLKSDLQKLKAFITQSKDEYRLPYGRGDIKLPRMASLAATCNSDRYLIDPTGNRRWWTVPRNRKYTREELKQLDALQLWAQVYAIVAPMDHDQMGDCYRLSDEEEAALSIRNGDHTKGVKGQDEIADILAQAERDGLKTRLMTIGEFKEKWPTLRPYSVQQISIALKLCAGIEAAPQRVGKGDTKKRLAMLPMPWA